MNAAASFSLASPRIAAYGRRGSVTRWGTLGLHDTNKSGPALTLRPGDIADLEAVLRLEGAAFASDRLSRRALRRFLTAERRPLIVARSAGRLIGYILVSLPGRARVARVYSLAVGAGEGRRGVGGELLRAAERYARAHGRQAIRLEARYDNIAAIALYQKHGYRPFGSCPGYYADGAEALRFEKTLAPAGVRREMAAPEKK